VSEETKLNDKSYIKNSIDFFANMAYSQFNENRETIGYNYRLFNGIIDQRHFEDDCGEVPVIKDYLETLKENLELPSHIRHYSLINPVINTMMGEQSKRPDVHRVRAMDDNSKEEELQYKTELYQKLVLQKAREVIMNRAAIKGVPLSDLPDEEVEQMTFESVKDMMLDYTSEAEKWANHTLSALKLEFNIKDKSEEAYKDLLISAREFYEIYEDNSKLGFNVRTLNPKNVWWKGTPDTKYTSGASRESGVPYCIGTIHVKELSEILQEVPELSYEEIEHLKEYMNNALLMGSKESNLFSNETGIKTINYETYDRAIYEERMFQQSQIGVQWRDDLSHFIGGSNAFSFGYKYVVVSGYFQSKKKIGKLTFIDENGEEQVTLVDESYKKSPNEINIEWGYINQWYSFKKIGPDIYFIKPFDFLDYAPIIGCIYQGKNAPPKSMLDQLKPLQSMFNVCMNQLWEVFDKEIGNVGVINSRRVPKLEGMNSYDAVDAWLDRARNEGIVIDDNSPENNSRGNPDNTTVARNMDLSRTAEIQSRLNTAVAIQEMANTLVGMNRQRMGSPLATETATANQNALVQSFAQTEPYFSAHNYVLNQLYQGILDAAQYIEQKKPFSTLSYINDVGAPKFFQIAGEDLRLRDLKVYVTSRAEDQQLFNEFRQLAQAMLQNGASLYEVSQLYITNSIREMQKAFKDNKDQRDQQVQQAQQLEQQKVEQESQIAQAQLEQEERHHQDELQMRKYEADLKANTDLAKAQISTFFQAPTTDQDNDGTPDIMEIANHQLTIQEQLQQRDFENRKLSLEQQKFMADQKQKAVDNDIAKEKLKNEKEKLKIQRKQANKKPASKK